MKKSIIFSLIICLILINQLDAQKGSLLKKVGNSMANELLGRKEKAEPEPEPASACAQPDVKMDLAMQYAQQMQQKMLSAGGISNSQPKLITNIPGATFDPLTSLGGILNGKVKYDDILLVAY